jgi:serine/threonine-protein kinase HipA
VKLEQMDLVEAARSAKAAVEGRMADILPQVIESGASTGGARPKQRIALCDDDPERVWYGKLLPPPGYDPWILKIETDPRRQYGAVEKAYYRLAEIAGLQVPETRLIASSSDGVEHFAVKRFDWLADDRLHCHTLAGMLNRDSHAGNTDYEEFLRTVLTVTQDQACVSEAFQRMVFNVSFGVRDDHSKNHAFVMDETGAWQLSPAYDVMYSRPGVGNGLHRQMPVLGRRQAIERGAFDTLARLFGIRRAWLNGVLDAMHDAADAWVPVCSELGIAEQRMREISDTWEFPGSEFTW